MKKSKKPIGVFDSGVGGLTVLESLMEELPKEDFIYIADQGNCPYGTKKDEEIIECILKVERFLVKEDVKAIVVACNTASLFEEYLKEEINIPLLCVIDATCDKAASITKNGNVAVLGTVATIKKGKYQDRLLLHGKNPIGVACSEFVDFIEKHELSDDLGQKIVDEKLLFLKDKNIDTLIHGCTHFSIIEDKMRKVLGNINYIACGDATSKKLKEVLKEKELLNQESNRRLVKIYTTGKKEDLLRAMKWFKKPHEEVVHIDL